MNMQTVKVSGLSGAALNWAVAKCLGFPVTIKNGQVLDAELLEMQADGSLELDYATNWAQGGPIIERELLQINPAFHNDTASVSPKWEKYGFRSITGWHWVAYVLGPNNIDENYESLGDTPLIAAMRCYCHAKLGDEIDIPEELHPCQQPNP